MENIEEIKKEITDVIKELKSIRNRLLQTQSKPEGEPERAQPEQTQPEQTQSE